MMAEFSFVNLEIWVKILIILQLFCYGSSFPVSYFKQRDDIVFEEDKLLFGSKLKLEDRERLGNACLMSAKFQEVDKGWNFHYFVFGRTPDFV